jgi:hypothetical protein
LSELLSIVITWSAFVAEAEGMDVVVLNTGAFGLSEEEVVVLDET